MNLDWQVLVIAHLTLLMRLAILATHAGSPSIGDETVQMQPGTATQQNGELS